MVRHTYVLHFVVCTLKYNKFAQTQPTNITFTTLEMFSLNQKVFAVFCGFKNSDSISETKTSARTKNTCSKKKLEEENEDEKGVSVSSEMTRLALLRLED